MESCGVGGFCPGAGYVAQPHCWTWGCLLHPLGCRSTMGGSCFPIQAPSSQPWAPPAWPGVLGVLRCSESRDRGCLHPLPARCSIAMTTMLEPAWCGQHLPPAAPAISGVLHDVGPPRCCKGHGEDRPCALAEQLAQSSQCSRVCPWGHPSLVPWL